MGVDAPSEGVRDVRNDNVVMGTFTSLRMSQQYKRG